MIILSTNQNNNTNNATIDEMVGKLKNNTSKNMLQAATSILKKMKKEIGQFYSILKNIDKKKDGSIEHMGSFLYGKKCSPTKETIEYAKIVYDMRNDLCIKMEKEMINDIQAGINPIANFEELFLGSCIYNLIDHSYIMEYLRLKNDSRPLLKIKKGTTDTELAKLITKHPSFNVISNYGSVNNAHILE